MSGKDRTNPVRQNIRIKQYLGWFIALISPFALGGIMEVTEVPLIAALIYWLICGILLRYILQKDLPYLKLQYKSIKKEILLLTILTGVCGYLYVQGIIPVKLPLRELLLNTILFSLLKGILEQLAWINIFDLAGSRIKLAGFVAVLLHLILLQGFFWGRFVPVPQENFTLFMLVQLAMFLTPISIYAKTKDLTIWSMQHIAFNLIVIYFGGFGIDMFIHI